MKHQTTDGIGGTQYKPKIKPSGNGKTKKKWIPQHKQFEGSVGEGQGFAFKRKEKAKHEYNRLLRKERKRNQAPQTVYRDQYPEHLKHLYLAEKEQLKKETWTHNVNRRRMRMKDHVEDSHKDNKEGSSKDYEEDHFKADAAIETQMEANDEKPTKESKSEIKQTQPNEKQKEISIPMSNRMRKKMLKKTSYQRTQEAFEKIQDDRRKKQEEYLKNKQQREEARQKYKQKKIETYQMLCKKTKKGQPNLNLQMEYLLQKIQRTDK